jgi:hypothetical protein
LALAKPGLADAIGEEHDAVAGWKGGPVMTCSLRGRFSGWYPAPKF